MAFTFIELLQKHKHLKWSLKREWRDKGIEQATNTRVVTLHTGTCIHVWTQWTSVMNNAPCEKSKIRTNENID